MVNPENLISQGTSHIDLKIRTILEKSNETLKQSYSLIC